MMQFIPVLIVFATILLFILKACGIIAVSYWTVLTPLLVYLGFIVIIAVLLLISIIVLSKGDDDKFDALFDKVMKRK